MRPLRGVLGESGQPLDSQIGADVHLEDEKLSGWCREGQFWLFWFTLRHKQCPKLGYLLGLCLRAISQVWDTGG